MRRWVVIGLSAMLLGCRGTATEVSNQLNIVDERQYRWMGGLAVMRLDFADGDRCYLVNGSGISCRFGNGGR